MLELHVTTKTCTKWHVVSYPLKRDVMVAREDYNDIVVLKWRYVRDFIILSIKHAHIMTPTSDSTYHSRSPKTKPMATIAYNNGNTGIERTDQMVSYSTTIRRSNNWYLKLALHFILGTTIVNRVSNRISNSHK